MWTLLIVVINSYAEVPTVMEFYNKAACTTAQVQIESKFKDIKSICVYQGE